MLGVKPEKEDTLRIFADKKIEAQNEIAIKQADLAISLGLTIVQRYYPYIDYLLAQGKTPEGIVEEMVDLHQRKKEIEQRIVELENENQRLREDLEDLKYYATPNIRFQIKVEALIWLWKQLLKAEILNIPINSAILFERFRFFLEKIDKMDEETILAKRSKILVAT